MADDESISQLFGRIRAFEWDERKRASNLRRHGIDFEDARGVLDDYSFVRRSDRDGEVRYQIFGIVEGWEVAIVCTLRGERCRIISARRARQDERRKYYDRLKR